MVRGNLPAAMQGMVVVPLFAGYDLRRRTGRLLELRRHRRPVRGVRLRRHRFRQPARRHGHQGRLPRRHGPRRRRSTSRARACGRRPTPTPPPAAPTHSGASTRWSPPSPPTAGRASTTPSSPPATRRSHCSRRRAVHDEHAVLRRTRTGDEGPGRLRPQGHRPRPCARRRPLRRRHRARRREPVEHAAQDQRDLRPHRLRRRRQVQRVRPAARRRCPRRRSQGLPVLAATTSTRAAWPTSTRRSSARSSPTR